MRERWKGLTVQQKSGGVLALISVGLTIILGFIATSSNAVPGILAVLAVAGQFAAAWLFSNHRKADPAHAKTIVRQLVKLAAKLGESVSFVETVQEKRGPPATEQELRDALTVLNVTLSGLTDTSITAIESWGDFDPQTLQELEWSGKHTPPNPGDDTNDNDGGQPK